MYVVNNSILCLQLQQIISEMKDTYSRARVCPHALNNYNYRYDGSCDLAIEPGKYVLLCFFNVGTRLKSYFISFTPHD